MAIISQTILSNAFLLMKISIKISLKFVPKGPINNIQVLVQVMAWRQPGDKPLTEPMVVKLLMHTCVTWPQWVKWLVWLSGSFWCGHWIEAFEDINIKETYKFTQDFYFVKVYTAFLFCGKVEGPKWF